MSLVKNIVNLVAFQPPSPPSYKETDEIIWINCQRSKPKHNLVPKKNIEEFEKKKVFIPGLLFKYKGFYFY
jgi:hypothetical protein